ncbi:MULTISPECIES: acetylornithine transaminase [Microbacterium]|uniref:acetylornithine transaminase n=1 Tax=Microbacterium TaxID=33882 RepID=UPI00217DC4BF|nr:MULTISPECIES: acetylornithine transaminase [Microbacterium]UWF76848.1 acetylornithine transaminase [Microbacterium neungamense]WCM55003.1 acetylornithine transaminase [Microbacterium sp. EF45047]
MIGWQHDASRDLMNLGGRLALLTHGEGSQVWDADGNRYLDFLGGIAVNCLGHAHPVFVEAVSRQAATLAHVSNYFATPQQLALAARLKRLAGTGEQGRVFLANSGTEANEMAIKLARLHGGAERPTILVVEGAFHGRTMGALSLTPKAAYRDPFQPAIPGVRTVARTLDSLEQAFDDTVSAIIVEPIQGEAGVVELPEGFLTRARELSTAHDALLILDEVQTGSGRTGEWFAFQREEAFGRDGVTPDAVTLAKSIGAGFPLGALITFGAASELFYPGTHNSTFGGNPLASAVADAVLGHIEDEGLLGNVTARGAQLRDGVSGLPLVTGTRGAGLLIGITLAHPVAGRVREAAHERGLIVNAPADDVIRIAPAYTIGDAEVSEFLTLFGAALAAVAETIDAPLETQK